MLAAHIPTAPLSPRRQLGEAAGPKDQGQIRSKIACLDVQFQFEVDVNKWKEQTN